MGAYAAARRNATLEDFSRDHRACVREAGIPIAREADRDTLFVYEDVYTSCLKARGWERIRNVSRTASGLFRGIEDNEVVPEDSVPRQVP